MSQLTFFTYPSCTSCRKTKKWLTAHSIDFEERHLFRETPSPRELLKILSLTTSGLDEILATRSQTYKDLGEKLEELSLSEVVQMVIKEPKLLRRPILTNGNKIVIGYNPDAFKNMAK
ncbi:MULTISPECIES: Spx/MgsR family RNA polymerase-binding regulatory protein [Bacillaceae]|uniref:Spx/MgsR family RNA polymerase-binding regulatory protein n=1 Tax=Bacillaceae TaxID=186817 RepID=UPI000BA76175|nr:MULTISPECIES: Spx/MgsR family RNA polymerase-binding regulatory protein [Bacillaceae]PAE23369.1 transcriptional regulator [Bacillus sp. 7894-2]URM34125.1 Spx/MgsR family RNA polymerase-binding regulatory protein [Cytobacillus firmus]